MDLVLSLPHKKGRKKGSTFFVFKAKDIFERNRNARTFVRIKNAKNVFRRLENKLAPINSITIILLQLGIFGVGGKRKTVTYILK